MNIFERTNTKIKLSTLVDSRMLLCANSGGGKSYTIRKILEEAGNDVLIVTKPHFECIKLICTACQEYKEQITFRFTISSANNEVLKFWDRNAPSFAERYKSLIHAYNMDFATSVSCEPFLDPFVTHLYDITKPYITDSFWIGKLRYFHGRVQLEGVTEAEKRIYVEPLKATQSDVVVKAIYEALKGKPYIKWKDSIREVIGISED